MLIKLTDSDGDPVFVNTDLIQFIVHDPSATKTYESIIQFQGNFLLIRETPREVFMKAGL